MGIALTSIPGWYLLVKSDYYRTRFGSKPPVWSDFYGSGDATLLPGIVCAIRTREAKEAKDRCYALHGVLRSLGVRLPTADYNESLRVSVL